MSTPTLDAANTMIGTANGVGILVAPVGTAGPTDGASAWPAGWETIGYVHEDGITLAQDITSESLRGWQSKSPLRTVITGKELTIDFTALEITPKTMAMYFDEPVGTGNATTFTLTVTSQGGAQEYAVGIDTMDGDAVLRYIFPRATLSGNGDINIEAADFQGLPITLTALDDAGVLATIIRGAAA